MAGLIARVFNRLGRSYIENQNQVNIGHQEQLDALKNRCESVELLIKKIENEKLSQDENLSQIKDMLNESYQYMNERKEMNPQIEENLRHNNHRIDVLESRADMLDVKVKSASRTVSAASAMSNESKSTEKLVQNEDEYNCIDYFDFENHFRGSREAIKAVQKQYLPYFKDHQNVLDLGCGRGEFLELLKENDVKAIGVECYSEFAEYCKMRELDVVEEDAIKYLEQQEKVGGIFAGQLIEHLKLNQIVRLCELAYEKLEEGSYVVLETPNPMSLAIYTHAFYMDPSHNKPVHPLLMEYFMKKAGFKEVQILFTESSKYPVDIPRLESSDIKNIEAFNQSMEEVSRTLFGSQDYAIIGRR